MTPTSLKEMAARVVKVNEIPYVTGDIPRTLFDYLNCANCCVNPNCKGNMFCKSSELAAYQLSRVRLTFAPLLNFSTLHSAT